MHLQLTSESKKQNQYGWQEYKNLLNKVNQLKADTLRHNTPDAWLQFKKQRNKCENLRSQLKLESFNEHIQKTSNKSKSAWKVFNNEIGKVLTQKPVQKLILHGKEINSEAAISEAFCKFFAEISTTNYTKSFLDEEIIIDPNNQMDNT
jgi:hypothetical protein